MNRYETREEKGVTNAGTDIFLLIRRFFWCVETHLELLAVSVVVEEARGNVGDVVLGMLEG